MWLFNKRNFEKLSAAAYAGVAIVIPTVGILAYYYNQRVARSITPSYQETFDYNQEPELSGAIKLDNTKLIEFTRFAQGLFVSEVLPLFAAAYTFAIGDNLLSGNRLRPSVVAITQTAIGMWLTLKSIPDLSANKLYDIRDDWKISRSTKSNVLGALFETAYLKMPALLPTFSVGRCYVVSCWNSC